MTTFVAPGNYVTDNEGFAPPTFGGAVAVIYDTVAYTDTTAKNLFVLPQGAVVVGITVNVSTEFNDTGTDLLDIGITGTADYFANNIAVSSPTQVMTGMQSGRLFSTPLTEPITVTATYTGENANASAGSATVCFLYILR